MPEYDKYMLDSDIIEEPMPLREIHAIRLMLHEKTKHMNPDEYTRYVREQTKDVILKYGLNVRRPEPRGESMVQ